MYWNFEKIIVKPGGRRFDGHERPISVEIGFGNGEYLQYLAASRPSSFAVGIEVSQWCASKAARRALANGLGNVRIICGDARHLLKLVFEPSCVSEIFMNFPCPWPKRRHTERRVARGDFADLLASVLAPNGTFTLATDVDWYAEATAEIFSSHPAFGTMPVIRNPERDYATKYERKWRSMGRDIFEFRAGKHGDFEQEDLEQGVKMNMKEDDETRMDELEIIERIEQPRTRGLLERVADLRGDEIEGAGYRVFFRDAYSDGRGDALVKTISVDEGFEQHYYLKITEHDNRLRVAADSVGHPYKTPGVRASVRHAAKKLALV